MQKAWIEDAGDDRLAFVHAVSGSDLDTLATYCREAGDSHKTGGDWKHAARVEGTVIIAWCNARGILWEQFMRDTAIQDRFLNDPANAAFRVWKGRI